MSGLDRDALEQDDILRIPSLPIPDKDPKTGAPGVAELDTPTGRGIVTQRERAMGYAKLTIEPYVNVAPIRDVDAAVRVRSRALRRGCLSSDSSHRGGTGEAGGP